MLNRSWIIVALTLCLVGFSFSAAAAERSQKDLEKLVEPIALYPDVLLQQVLAAATFPEQIVDAAIFLEKNKDPKQILDQPWDASVKAVADYPSVLALMATDIDWTIGLGEAFLNQNKDLRRAVQSMRARAKSAGNLKDSAEQNVVVEQAPSGEQVIVIQPAQPQVIYVPTTTTAAVYTQPVSSASALQPLATFGLGMALGYAAGNNNHYYGYGSPGYWYRDDAANNWIDHRNDRWNDVNDNYRDRQDFRQDQYNKAADYRRDNYDQLKSKQSDYLNQARNRAGEMSPEQRAQAQQRAQQGKQQWQAKSPDQRAQAQQRAQQGKEQWQARSPDQRAQAQQRAQQGKEQWQARSPDQRAQAQQRAQQGKNQWQARSPDQRAQAQQRLNSARSSGQLQAKAQTVRRNPQTMQQAQRARYSGASQRGSYDRGGALSMNHGARSASARGTASLQRSGSRGRSYSGGSRGRSYSGGGRSYGGSRGRSGGGRGGRR